MANDAHLDLAPGIRVPRSALIYTASRSGGPGGQHANTADSRVTLRVRLQAIQGGDAGFLQRLRRAAGRRLAAGDELILHEQATRSQNRNRELVTRRFVELVDRVARPPKRRRPTRPGRGAIQRRLDAKQRQGDKKRRRSQRDVD